MISFCLTESNLKVGQLVLHLQALEIQQLSAQFLLHESTQRYKHPLPPNYFPKQIPSTPGPTLLYHP